MLKKKLSKLIGLKKDEFDKFVLSHKIQLQSARLIPALKTGDEMALTSIFLSTLKLVKEYRDGFFKELRLSRSGKIYFYTEVSFKEISSSRIDGLIIVVVKGKIIDAAFLEMKSGKNKLDSAQIEKYITLAKKLKVTKLVTISNEFVADMSHSPIKVKTPKSIALSHFSWTYLITKAQLLLFKNDTNIADVDQVEIMKEVLYYFENPASGVRGYTQMKAGWKELAENIHAQKPLKTKDKYIAEAVLSWHEEEKDMALLLSRKLGVLVKPISKSKDKHTDDVKRIIKDNFIAGGVAVKGAVSNIKIKADFERRTISMSIKIIPPQNKNNSAKVTWLSKQILKCDKKAELSFEKLRKDFWIEADIKFIKENVKIKLTNLDELPGIVKEKNDVQTFTISAIKSLGAKFTNPKKVIEIMEVMLIDFYESVVQHMVNWKKSPPKIVEQKREAWEVDPKQITSTIRSLQPIKSPENS